MKTKNTKSLTHRLLSYIAQFRQDSLAQPNTSMLLFVRIQSTLEHALAKLSRQNQAAVTLAERIQTNLLRLGLFMAAHVRNPALERTVKTAIERQLSQFVGITDTATA